MGHGFGIKCENCEYKTEVFLSIGMNFPTFRDILGRVKNSEKKKILEQVGEAIPLVTDYTESLFYCESCETIENQTEFTLIAEGGVSISSNHTCGRCRRQMTRHDESLEGVSCPKCRQKTLIQDGYLLWD